MMSSIMYRNTKKSSTQPEQDQCDEVSTEKEGAVQDTYGEQG